jgi:hypothetical protein
MILKLANEVAIKHQTSVSYSNFHTWEHFQQFQTGQEASEAPSPSSSQSFQNCLYMANSCAEALRAALLQQGTENAPLADRVQIATDCWKQNPTSSRQYHCLVMLRLPDVSIVIDLVAHPYALRVNVDELWEAKFSIYRFRYVAIGAARLLVHVDMFDKDKHNVLPHPLTNQFLKYNDPFRDIRGGFKGGVEHLAFPTDSYAGRVPGRRSIFVDQIWNHRPTSPAIPHYRLQDGTGRYLVESCKIGIDLANRYIWVTAIPLEWIHDPENAYLLCRLKDRSSYIILGDGPEHVFGEFQVALLTLTDIRKGFAKRTENNLKFMLELAEALGLEEGELMRIAGIMLRYWQEEEVRREPRKDLKRKRTADAQGWYMFRFSFQSSYTLLLSISY